MAIFLLSLSVLLLAVGAWLVWRAGLGRRAAGLPRGRIVYADTGEWSTVARPYFSPTHRLTGKPDYLVETRKGPVPVEVKHTKVPPDGQAYEAHIMQLASYCLLVEEAHGKRPPYGLIRYQDALIQIDYTPALRRTLLAVMADMRKGHSRRSVRRSHEDAARCMACGLRHTCGEDALTFPI